MARSYPWRNLFTRKFLAKWLSARPPPTRKAQVPTTGEVRPAGGALGARTLRAVRDLERRGAEVLVAADIIRTGAVTPTLTSVAVLGAIFQGQGHSSLESSLQGSGIGGCGS